VEAMTKRTVSVDDLYGGRHFPHGRVRDGSSRRIECEPSFEPEQSGRGSEEILSRKGRVFNEVAVQDPEDRHDNSKTARYDNDHPNDWVRGTGEDATTKPGFDFGNSWRLRDGGLDQRSGSDPATFRRPVGEK
jgi:hypothetical protein